MRHKIIVVTGPETALGFQLAGVEVEEAASSREAEDKVEKIILGSDFGLVAVNEDYLRDFGDRVKRLISEAELPIVVAFPGKEANVWKVEDRMNYVMELIRSTIGFHIKLSR